MPEPQVIELNADFQPVRAGEAVAWVKVTYPDGRMIIGVPVDTAQKDAGLRAQVAHSMQVADEDDLTVFLRYLAGDYPGLPGQ